MAASGGIARTWFILAVLSVAFLPFASGTAFAQDQVTHPAFDLYEKKKWAAAFPDVLGLAEAGHPRAMLLAGEMFIEGRGTSQSEDKGLEWLKKAAEAGLAREANFAIGSYFVHWMKDYATAAEYVIRAAKLGDPEAQTMLADMYAIGRGVPRDSASAEKWSRAAAASTDNVWTIYRAALSYPKGTDQNIELLRSAAQKGLALAQDDLGAMYLEGSVVPRDLEEAERWLTMAVSQDLPAAYLHMGSLYLQIGQPKNSIRCYIDAFRSGRKSEDQEITKQALTALMAGGIVGHIDKESQLIAEGDRSPVGICKSDVRDYFSTLLQSYIYDARR